jgi:isopentenyl phosphate kinase
MLNGSLTEVSNVEDFIINNELQIKSLYKDARKFIPQDDYPDPDTYTEVLTSAVVICLLHGEDVFDGSVDSEVLSDYSEGFVQNLAQVLVTTYMIWNMEAAGLVERDGTSFRLKEEGPDKGPRPNPNG